MRLHRNLVNAVIEGLRLIFEEGHYADKAIQHTLKKDKRWGARDRSFIAETMYEMVRWKRLYANIAEAREPYTIPKLWRMFAVWAVLRGIRLPDWQELEATPTRKIKGRYDELSKVRKYRESVPDWLDDLGMKELPAIWPQEIQALNQIAPVVLRVNTLLTDRKMLIESLWKEGVETFAVEEAEDAVQLYHRENVFSTQAFADGLFEVQDTSSQQVATMLQVAPGQRVVDTCAGAGGKSLHLAALMQNKGQLLAMDIYKNKLFELKRRARRAQAFNVQARLIETTKDYKKMYGKADRVLIDSPCSGLGILRRNPDAKWKLSLQQIDQIRQTQSEILQNYAPMTKPGGKLVYATCSILPSENEEQIEAFLRTEVGQAFTVEKSKSILVSESGNDGFYMVRLRRN